MLEQLIVIQPTPFCNMRCRYCYLPDRDSHVKMSDAVLQAILESIEHSDLVSENPTIVWHAGEPLTVGKAFFRHALEATRQISLRGRKAISHRVQTNGVLLDDSWLDLFQSHNVKLGLSIDGPAKLHDLHRHTRRGGGTHERVMKAVRLLHARRYPFSAIMVITQDALDQADEVFDYFVSAEIPLVGLNVEELESANAASTLRGPDVERDLHHFYLRLLSGKRQADAPCDSGSSTIFCRCWMTQATCQPESVFKAKFGRYCLQYLELRHQRPFQHLLSRAPRE